MSKRKIYLIWTSENAGDRFPADLVVTLMGEIQFFDNGIKVKSYPRSKFIRYNPKWLEEHTE